MIPKPYYKYVNVFNYYFRYYFDGQGKAVRPVIAMTVGHAFNLHCGVPENSDIYAKQRKVAIISEMIHTASLVHDDILDRYLNCRFCI
jgi:decaprenyl-diphosphate synthase subunit 1